MRRARFQIPANQPKQFNGASRATVVIEQPSPGGPARMRVRPLRSRREFVIDLADLAEIAIWRAIKGAI